MKAVQEQPPQNRGIGGHHAAASRISCVTRAFTAGDVLCHIIDLDTQRAIHSNTTRVPKSDADISAAPADAIAATRMPKPGRTRRQKDKPCVTLPV